MRPPSQFMIRGFTSCRDVNREDVATAPSPSLKRQGCVYATPYELILAVAHVVELAKGVGWNPRIVDLRTERKPFGYGIRRGESNRGICKLSAYAFVSYVFAPSVIAESERSGRGERQCVEYLEVVRETKREVYR